MDLKNKKMCYESGFKMCISIHDTYLRRILFFGSDVWYLHEYIKLQLLVSYVD